MKEGEEVSGRSRTPRGPIEALEAHVLVSTEYMVLGDVSFAGHLARGTVLGQSISQETRGGVLFPRFLDPSIS